MNSVIHKSFPEHDFIKLYPVNQSPPILCNPMDWSMPGTCSCLSPTSGASSNSCPLSWWYHPTISLSQPFSSCLQSFPLSGSFQMSQFFASGGQSIRVSASASVLPMNIQDWFPLGGTSLISLQSQGLSGVFSNTAVQKHQFVGAHSWKWVLKFCALGTFLASLKSTVRKK